MVAAIVPKFDSVIPLNLARPMLLAAQDCQERGDLIGCGVRLREALRRQLFAMCQFHACVPVGKFAHTPAAMLKALRAGGECDKGGARIVTDIIDIGNRAAHLSRVKAGELIGAMELLHYIIDTNPCGDTFERFPKPATDCDCGGWDDDDARIGGKAVRCENRKLRCPRSIA